MGCCSHGGPSASRRKLQNDPTVSSCGSQDLKSATLTLWIFDSKETRARDDTGMCEDAPGAAAWPEWFPELTLPHCRGLSHPRRGGSSRGGGEASMGKALTWVSDRTVTCHCTHQTLQTPGSHRNGNRGSDASPHLSHCPPHTIKWKGTKPVNDTWDRETSCSPLW